MRRTINRDIFKAKAPRSPLDQYITSGFVPHKRGPQANIGGLGSVPVATGPSLQPGTFRPTLSAPKPLVDPVSGKLYSSQTGTITPDSGYLDYLQGGGGGGGGGGGIVGDLQTTLEGYKSWPIWVWVVLGGGGIYFWNRQQGKGKGKK